MDVLTMRTTFTDEVGDLDAEPGSKEWAIAVRGEISLALAEHTSSGSHLHNMLTAFEQYQGYRVLVKPDGTPFQDIREWSTFPPPHGLGMPLDDVKRTAVQRAAQATTGEAAPEGRPKTENSINYTVLDDRAKNNGVSRATQHKLDRLARERPDLLEQVKTGDLSAHRAAIVAGFIKDNPRVAIPMDNPKSAAQIIAERMTPDDVHQLLAELRDLIS